MKVFDTEGQFDDFVGNVAADLKDEFQWVPYLRNNRLISDKEFPAGISLDKVDGSFKVTVLTVQAPDFESAQALVANENPIQTRSIQLNLTLDQFFTLFKRFSIVLGRKGIDIVGHAIAAN